MKKLLYALLTVAAGLALASCVKEPVSVPDPAQGGEPIPVSFSVNLGGALTKAAPEASDFDNASGEFKLYVAVFSKTNGALISTSKIGGTGFEPVETVTAKNVSIVLTLSRKQDYKVVFFAMHEGAYDVNFADNNVATFTFKRSVKANDASLDAFYAAVDVSADTKKYDVTMKRPFAQLNVFATKDNVPAGQTAFASTMTVTAPASFNLYSGAAGTDVQDITFENNAIAATPLSNYKDTHVWIGMNFVLVPASGKVTVGAFAESGMTEPVRVGEVPVKVNSRTNIVGSIYSLSDYFFNVVTDSNFADESEAALEFGEGGEGGEGGGESGGETPTDTEVAIAGGNTYTETAPFAIDASNPNAPKKVTLTVNGGDSFATINAGAAQGQQVTAISSNAQVATVAVSGNDVVITPVGKGKAKITVSIPAYTKASYNAQTFDFWVEITGISSGSGEGGGGEEEGGSDTIVFADLNLENGTQYKDAFTQGSMSVQFGSGSNDGKYYTTGSGMRIYGDGWVTVSSSKTITKIEYTFDPTEQKDGDVTKTFLPDEATFGSVAPGSYDLATQTWTGSAKSVTLTRATGTGHWRLQQVKVYYADGQGGGGETTTVTATLDVSPASLNLTAGGTATITASTNSTAKPTFVSSNTSVADVDANGLVTAKAAGTATITVSVAAVEGAFTAASKTVPVTVAAAGGGTGEETKVTLTNAEILPATVDAEITGSNPSYRDATITSASGTWTANMAKHKDGLKYLQLRNKKGAYITSPLFTSAVSKVVVTLTSEDVDLLDRTLHAVPPATTLPTGQDASGKDIVYAATEWADEYGCVRTGAEKGAEVTIDFAEGSDIKQFKLIVEGGATYIDHIDVYY